jgi:hypothetical protein
VPSAPPYPSLGQDGRYVTLTYASKLTVEESR